ncbi:MAG: hypothetical protein SGI77_04275 [Pirellulaceae bacterium]|nr:hypothetical protein [Pirellulaceae bacterium]
MPIVSRDEKAKVDGKGKPDPLPRVELGALRVLPASGSDSRVALKPSHWHELQQNARANDADEALTLNCMAIERQFPFRPIPLPLLREPVSFERNISLPRGQRKLLGVEMFFPSVPVKMDTEVGNKSSIRLAYFPRTIGASVREETYPVEVMPDYQYNFVVLSQLPERYQFINGMSCIVWPSKSLMEDQQVSPFRVVQIAQADAQNSLPSWLGTWTSTSHLMWNDCSPTALVEKQQIALVDWLHFGGQIIINGPESQATLKDSFLSNYLPFKKIEAGQWNTDQWERFSRHWSIAKADEKLAQAIALPSTAPPTIQGELHSEARWVQGCEGLVAERFVGGGRVVMTTFSLGESMLVRWPSYSSFFNAALLHRPPRVWRMTSQFNEGDMEFAGNQRNLARDPRLVTRFRLLGRDLGSHELDWNRRNALEAASNEIPTIASGQSISQIEADSAFTKIATRTLVKASGIQVPRMKTILQLLGGYFLVLVPLNWAFFRLLGRVEYAWLAAPLIAVVGAVVVARSVQLDIGFSRSQSTLNLLELKSGYGRGHFSSYLSLYTSLSTNYSARYPDNEGIVLPVATVIQRASARRNDDSYIRYETASDKGSGLASFPVISNSTCMLRAEDTHSLDGDIRIAIDSSDANLIRIDNRSSLVVQDVVIECKSIDGQVIRAKIDRLGAQAETRVTLASQMDGHDSSDPSRTTDPAKVALGSGLEIKPVIDEVLANHRLGVGDVILIGWTEQLKSKLEVKPNAPQNLEKSLVVVKLDAVSALTISPDLNLPSYKLEETEEAAGTGL